MMMTDDYGLVLREDYLYIMKRKGSYEEYVKSQVEPTSIPDNQVISVFKDSSGTLWFGTRQGLARYKKARIILQYIAASSYKGFSPI